MTTFTKATISALTLCGKILAAGVVSEPSYGSQGAQGTSFNGMSFQGTNLNGMCLQGVALNGMNLQGTNLNGMSLQGTSFNGISGGLDGRVLGIELPTPSQASE